MDIGASNWNESDTSNNTPAPDGAPEGMFPSGVNDTIRAVMGAIKRWFTWLSSKVTAGSSTAYTLTYAIGPGALVDGMTHLVQFHTTNGANATLNVQGLGTRPIYFYSGGTWSQVPAGTITTNMVCKVAYDIASAVYRIVTWPTPPLGAITSSLPSDVALTNTGTYFDGPSVAQGTAGTWFVSGTVTLADGAGAASFLLQLTDGTTIIATTQAYVPLVNIGIPASLSGLITAPAGNLRIRVRDASSAAGGIVSNATGDGKSSTITAIRIG
jgi:hypothetical protein